MYQSKKARTEGITSTEMVKNVLILKGKSTSQIINDSLRDLNMLCKPNAKALNRKNEILPFEDVGSLEFLTQKNDCSLFALGSHTKKRPQNLTLGRMYDGHLLDMFEFGIDQMQSMYEFSGAKKGVGSKPVMVFQGDQWQNDSLYSSIQNLLVDFFRGFKADKLSLQGVDHAIVCSCIDGKIYLRTYSIAYRKSETKVPHVSLNSMGPHFDLTVRRHQLASPDLWKLANKKDKTNVTKKKKNVGSTSLGDKVGRIHMKKQNLDKMNVRKMPVLRNRKRAADPDNSAATAAAVSEDSRSKKPRTSD